MKSFWTVLGPELPAFEAARGDRRTIEEGIEVVAVGFAESDEVLAGRWTELSLEVDLGERMSCEL